MNIIIWCSNDCYWLWVVVSWPTSIRNKFLSQFLQAPPILATTFALFFCKSSSDIFFGSSPHYMVVTTQVLGVRYDYPLYLDGVIGTNYQCLKLISNTQTQISHLLFIPRRFCFISSPGRSLCLWLERETASSNLKGKRIKDEPCKMRCCKKVLVPTGGLEPPIFGLGDRRLIHWATRARLHLIPGKFDKSCNTLTNTQST